MKPSKVFGRKRGKSPSSRRSPQTPLVPLASAVLAQLSEPNNPAISTRRSQAFLVKALSSGPHPHPTHTSSAPFTPTPPPSGGDNKTEPHDGKTVRLLPFSVGVVAGSRANLILTVPTSAEHSQHLSGGPPGEVPLLHDQSGDKGSSLLAVVQSGHQRESSTTLRICTFLVRISDCKDKREDR